MLNALEWSALRMSLLVAGAGLAVAVPLGVFLGWLLARRRFRGKALLEALIFLPLVLPPVLTGYLLLVVFGREGGLGRLAWQGLGVQIAFTWVAMALAAAVVGLPLLVRSVRLAVEGVDPGLEAASRTLGHGPWRTLWKVTLPLARPGIIAGAVLAFARGLGEFGATVMVAPNVPGTRTLALEIYRQAAIPGHEAEIFRLAAVSVGLSVAALLVTEWIAARERRSGR